MITPLIFIIISTVFFLIWERVAHGRQLPNSSEWYYRALSINFTQLGITFLIGKLWNSLADEWHIFNLSNIKMPFYEGFIGWLIGTFVFYWWHRLRHKKVWWRIFHQLHSPSRIEVVTSM